MGGLRRKRLKNKKGEFILGAAMLQSLTKKLCKRSNDIYLTMIDLTCHKLLGLIYDWENDYKEDIL